MKRIAEYTDAELAQLGGHIGPTPGGVRTSAGRRLRAVSTAIRFPRSNHLPQRRELFAIQRQPEK